MIPKWNWLCVGLLLSASVLIAGTEDSNAKTEEVEGEDHEESETRQDIVPSIEVEYKTPVPKGEVFFAETFDEGTLDGWVLSKTKKDNTDEDIAKYDGLWTIEELKENTIPGDRGLVLKSRAKHHAIAAMLKTPFIFENEPLIVQYEVNFQDGIDCGGAYIKLLSSTDELDLEEFHDRTPYTIMFGPDKCGEDYKLHFIFRHKHLKTGEYEEKHCKRPEVDLRKFYMDKKTHLHTLVLMPDNSFEVLIDQSVVSKGSLLEDFTPPVNPPKEVDDVNDKKPEDWDDRPKIPDSDAVKPDDWDEDAPANIVDETAQKPEGWLDDEPEYIPDQNAVKPGDWDEEMDGEWEAPLIANPVCKTAPGCGVWDPPLISNPNYKGKWKPPLIDNPSYQGIWSPRKIENPDYFEDPKPFAMTPIGAIGLELWSMTSDIYFDNFIICSEKEVADKWAADGWSLKKLVASANEPGVIRQMMSAAEERPWLWIIYILTAGLPFGLLILFCWPSKKIKEAANGNGKKTDALLYKDDEEPSKETEEKKEMEVQPVIKYEESSENDEEHHNSDNMSEMAEGRQEDENSRSEKSGSEAEMKDTDGYAESGDGSKKIVRKRVIPKQE
ncbi:calmegin [Protopterus annectens]|uniref:calmegin n=1 Tax=Protopterus annectens TaxID=7888 RepID=UPI001CFC2571|nr:calmegin [Protopterus annectens]